ncbi:MULTISPECIES: GNAT family N-acetyltransferase [unclassified Rubrivivax]|uniref:GNAT family N-acetyltransferase n=1 Tax=unclassified Rubrivivax TaxID=2649762 RepID=UPI001E4DE265|nr:MULTISPECIES: GNAT family N-acetyltransferase [unclassified Rubrivivax]MCC9597996.1 GNAT family N-acetyltransferase [Rubrivivax sp. JA1055]MCC9645747.1 GNAT family N-acetyltransferase [Rubrivivax sp. JA1029]
MTAMWTVRTVGPDDAASIARHRYFRGEPQEDLDAYTAWVVSRIERGTYVGFVAEAESQVVGGAGAVLLDWGPTRGETSGIRARIVNVYTEEPWRKRGIAKALVDKVMGACTEAGIRVFSLAASEEAAPMYRALGFARYANEMILRRS